MLRRVFTTSARRLHAKQLVYSEHGDPSKVVALQTVELPSKLADGHVLIKWKAAPINPADLNQIQGVYPVKPPLPAVGGNEGYGVVEQVGAGVAGLKVGDHVLRGLSEHGTWRDFGHHKADDLYRIDGDISHEGAATLQVNPPTAYRMLKDFVSLRAGDTVIQNGATSAVGRAVIQICRSMGVKTVNLVRPRDDLDAVVADLKSLGADLVITEEQLLKQYRRDVKDVALALNCVGGRSTMFLSNALRQGGYMVTYGGMSKQPLQIPTGPLIFKDIRLAGFWMTRWYGRKENKQARDEMLKELAGMLKDGSLVPPKCEHVALEDCQKALDTAANSFVKKQLFVME